MITAVLFEIDSVGHALSIPFLSVFLSIRLLLSILFTSLSLSCLLDSIVVVALFLCFGLDISLSLNRV